jgi:hypothetical protein
MRSTTSYFLKVIVSSPIAHKWLTNAVEMPSLDGFQEFRHLFGINEFIHVEFENGINKICIPNELSEKQIMHLIDAFKVFLSAKDLALCSLEYMTRKIYLL